MKTYRVTITDLRTQVFQEYDMAAASPSVAIDRAINRWDREHEPGHPLSIIVDENDAPKKKRGAK